MKYVREGLILFVALIAGAFIYACLHDLSGVVER